MEETRYGQILALAAIPHSRPWINELVDYCNDLRKHVAFLEKQRACLICDMAAAREEIRQLSRLCEPINDARNSEEPAECAGPPHAT